MAGSRSKHESEGEMMESAGMMRWLLTYADMITLLLILFVILYAISTISPKKFQSFEKGIVPAVSPGSNPLEKGSLSLLKNPSVLFHLGAQSISAMTLATNTIQGTPLQAVTAATSSQLAQLIEQALQKAGLAQYASVEVTPQGTVVEILATTSFASYSAQLNGVGQAIVDTVAGVISGIPNDMLIGGYTDNNPVVCTPNPISCPYNNNFSLSAARASSVVTRLLTVDTIGSQRLFGWFAGPNDPVAANDNSNGIAIPANQALNRRVDIEVLNASANGQVTGPTGPGSSANSPTAVAPPVISGTAPNAAGSGTTGTPSSPSVISQNGVAVPKLQVGNSSSAQNNATGGH